MISLLWDTQNAKAEGMREKACVLAANEYRISFSGDEYVLHLGMTL